MRSAKSGTSRSRPTFSMTTVCCKNRHSTRFRVSSSVFDFRLYVLWPKRFLTKLFCLFLAVLAIFFSQIYLFFRIFPLFQAILNFDWQHFYGATRWSVGVEDVKRAHFMPDMNFVTFICLYGTLDSLITIAYHFTTWNSSIFFFSLKIDDPSLGVFFCFWGVCVADSASSGTTNQYGLLGLQRWKNF